MSVFNAGNAENLIKKLANLNISETTAEASNIASIKKDLQMFVQASDNNATSADTVSLSNQSKTLQAKLDQYEKEIKLLEEQMAKKDEEIKEESEKIQNLSLSAQSKSKQLEKQQKNDVANIVQDVMGSFKRGRIEKDEVSGEIRKRVKDAKNTSLAGEIDLILTTLDNKKTELDGLVKNITSLTEQRSALQAKFVATNSAMNILTKSVSQIGAVQSSYTNSDNDASNPIYSLKKVDVVTDIAEKFSVSNENNAQNNVKNKTTSNLDTIKDKYKDFLSNTKTSGVDLNSSKNKATQDLASLMNNEEFINDLKNSGLTAYEVKNFFSEHFSNANVRLDKNTGAFSVPYGHDKASKDAYAKLTTLVGTFPATNAGLGSSIYYDATNVEKFAQNSIGNDANGNPINAQLQTLANNYNEIMNTLDKNGFTFKESMFALFNKDTGVFKDNGVISYVIDENGKPTYKIENAADLETAKFLENFVDKTNGTWGETPKGYAEAVNNHTNRTGTEYKEQTEVKKEVAQNTTVKRTDPLSFRAGDNKEYIFALDRNKDGKFSGPSDFVGGTNSKTWLEDLKSLDSNNDDRLSNEELNQLRLLGVEFEDGAKTTETSQTTNLNYGLHSASNLGITEIDLSAISQDNVNSNTGKVDINNSAIYNDKFSFTMNGETVEATRKDETSEYMNKVYGTVNGKNFEVGITSSDVENFVDDSLKEFKQQNSSFDSFMQDAATVLNVDKVSADTQEAHKQTMNRITDNTNAQIIQAGNKAQASTNAVNWSTLQSEIRTIANNRDVSIDMEQAHGFYVQNGGLTAEQIVDKCLELANDIKEPDGEKGKLQDAAWETIMAGYKEGVSISLDEAQELLSSGKSKNEIIEQFKKQRDEN